MHPNLQQAHKALICSITQPLCPHPCHNTHATAHQLPTHLISFSFCRLRPCMVER
jgi:hypothetical protein